MSSQPQQTTGLSVDDQLPPSYSQATLVGTESNHSSQVTITIPEFIYHESDPETVYDFDIEEGRMTTSGIGRLRFVKWVAMAQKILFLTALGALIGIGIFGLIKELDLRYGILSRR